MVPLCLTITSSKEILMLQNRFRTLGAALAFALLASAAQAEDGAPAPFQLALWNPVQIVDAERSIRGFRYSLFWGVNHDVAGADLSTLANKASGDVVGYQGAVMLNLVDGHFEGHQCALLNMVGGDFTGFQLGLFSGSADGHMRGLQWSLTGGSTAGEFTGMQSSGLINTTRRGTGLQAAGLINNTQELTGVQASALINIAEDLRGVQLGLLNFNKNGFLPFFPIINIGL
jgi:hypothetical protein